MLLMQKDMEGEGAQGELLSNCRASDRHHAGTQMGVAVRSCVYVYVSKPLLSKCNGRGAVPMGSGRRLGPNAQSINGDSGASRSHVPWAHFALWGTLKGGNEGQIRAARPHLSTPKGTQLYVTKEPPKTPA